MTTFDLRPKTYHGTIRAVPGTGRPLRLRGLQAFASDAWPDLPLGAELVIMPREDFEIIVADLAGRYVTPCRNPRLVRIPRAEGNHPFVWQRIFYALFIASCFALMLIDVLREAFKHAR